MHVTLSRRNLLTLLSKLDRKAAGDASACAIIKPLDDTLDKTIMIRAEEDAVVYADRKAGGVYYADDPTIANYAPVKSPWKKAEQGVYGDEYQGQTAEPKK